MSPAVIACALLTVLLWGPAPVGTKFAVEGMSPLAAAVLRTVLAGGPALILALALRIPPPEGWANRLVLAISAVSGFILYPLLFSFGMARTSGVHGAMILALLPMVTGAIAGIVDRRPPALRWWLGCAIAAAGEALLIGSRSDLSAGGGDLFGDLLVLCGGVFAAAGYVAGAKLKERGYPAQGTTYWALVIASLILVPLLPGVVSGVAWAAMPRSAWIGLLYLVVGVSVVGYICWYWALGRGGIQRVSVFQFLQPASGVAAAVLLLGDSFDLTTLAAIVIVMSGVWTATRTRPS
ncbi:DMT family transporter [Blastochloris viridis]|uniref:O-acetylserine/cysteine export protein n=1 Tax=Blastochloris viridis TaxID=1079 RepID=A0A0H5BEI7_BLAVI|nr:DMT family transporter [Blastochloris viridis]ALK10557.1 O-acetylserine/cysteine export protein [Blastochloris viridis]BAR99489.1 permease of the drug/metabolite transporter superfamily [Blastochloris viridis]CUU43219.1 O-acetylserine/cysteine export protein [Blastochloris viridis]